MTKIETVLAFMQIMTELMSSDYERKRAFRPVLLKNLEELIEELKKII